MDTADDAFHAYGDLLFFDSGITVASSGDGIDSNGDLLITGGPVRMGLMGDQPETSGEASGE